MSSPRSSKRTRRRTPLLLAGVIAALLVASMTVAGGAVGEAQTTGLTEIEFQGDHTTVTSLTAWIDWIAGERPAPRPLHDTPLNADRFAPSYAGYRDCYEGQPLEYGRRCNLAVSVLNTSDEPASMSVRVEGDVAASDVFVAPTDPLQHSDGTHRTQQVQPGDTASFAKLIEHRSTGAGAVTLTVLSDHQPVATATYAFAGTVWIPSVPTNVHLGTRPDSLVLIWDPPVSDGGSPLTGYEVRLLEVNPFYDPSSWDGDHRRWLSDPIACDFRERPELTTCDMPNNGLSTIGPGMYQLRVQALNASGVEYLGPFLYGLHFTDPFTVDRTLTHPQPLPPNQPPVLSLSTSKFHVIVGERLGITGSTHDADGDSVSITASAGTVTTSGDTWSWSHPPLDEPGTLAVSLTATDARGATSMLFLTLTASSPPPASTVQGALSVAQIVAATDYNPISHARVLRLYQAIFGRYPDLEGAKYWIDLNNRGHGVLAIAGYMSVSTEWSDTYRKTTNTQFVAAVYTNVLGRDYDLAGFNYWLELVQSGRLTRPQMIYYVTANPEFTRAYPFQP